jgi:hypothetical protein
MHLLISLALAQSSPRPTALEVLTVLSDTPCPTAPASHAPGVVRTNIGVMRRLEDGTYAYGCPARWGDDPEAQVAVSADGVTWMIAASGQAWLSIDAGCGARQLPLPEGFVATDVMSWRNALWVLAEAPTQGAGRLLRWDGQTFLDVAIWPDFVPDGMTPEGADKLWLAGAGPTPQVRRLLFTGGLAGDAPLPGLPEDVRDLERLVPVAAQDGEVWLRVERYSERWLWSAKGVDDAVSFNDDGHRWRTVIGPVQLDGRWWMIADQLLHRADPGSPIWTETDVSPGWTCLHRVGERVFACTVPAMFGVLGIGPRGTTNAVEVFTLDMVGPPAPTCGQPAACEEDWQELGGVAEITEAEEPAICPDGTTASDLDTSACGCAQGRASWMVAGLVLLWGRRRDHGRPSPG